MTARLIHNIGTFPHSNYDTRMQVIKAAERGDQLTFDGVYLNVWQNRDVLYWAKKPPILFVMGAYLGGDNAFDAVPNVLPIELYCSVEQLFELRDKYNCILGWHTWTHADLTRLPDAQVMEEINALFPVEHFAYPYGKFDARVEALVKSAGYKYAWSVDKGNGSDFQLRREYIT